MTSTSQSALSSTDYVRVLPLLSLNETDAGNAECFALLYGNRFRFDHSRGKWLVWNGRYWSADETGEADRAALDTARQRLMGAMQITDPKRRTSSVEWSLHSEST